MVRAKFTRRRNMGAGPLTKFGAIQLRGGSKVAGGPYVTTAEVIAAWEAHKEAVLATWGFPYPPFGQWVSEVASPEDDLDALSTHWLHSSQRRQYGDGQTDPWPPKEI